VQRVKFQAGSFQSLEKLRSGFPTIGRSGSQFFQSLETSGTSWTQLTHLHLRHTANYCGSPCR
jgi:hypothetical protein